MTTRRARRAWPRTLAGGLAAALAACASVSSSEVHTVSHGDTELRVSARAERGATADRLVLVVNGADVASGPFGAEQAAGTTLRGVYEGIPVEARCRHRWRPGLHIAYRCHVRVAGGDAFALDL